MPFVRPLPTMEVVFHRTSEREYAISVCRPGRAPTEPCPAPGYDPRMPHDLAHLAIELELGLQHAIYGQVAAGGSFLRRHDGETLPADKRAASRARRRNKRRTDRLARDGRDQTALSEHAVNICVTAWLAAPDACQRVPSNIRKMRAALPAHEQERLTDDVIMRACTRLNSLSARWRRLDVGQSMMVAWKPRNSRS